jgi:prophage DNA circulation protein
MVMPGWEQRLKSASFRGVPFGTFDYRTDGGRRVALHEYPFRDDNYPEDLGLASDNYEINAFVIGDDHDTSADALEAALRHSGAGELIHPRHGTLNVQVQTYQRSETTTEGGMTKFRITAVIAGKPRYPTATRNAQAELLAQVNSLRTLNVTETLATAVQLYATLNDGALLTAQIDAAQQQLTDATWLESSATASGCSSLIADALPLSGSGISASVTPLTGFLFDVAAAVVGINRLPDALADTASGGWLTQAGALSLDTLRESQPLALGKCEALLQALPATEDAAPASLYLLPAAQTIELVTQTATTAALLPYESYSEAMIALDQAHALLDAVTPALRITSTTGSVTAQHYEGLRELRVLIADAINQQALTLPEIAYAEVARPAPALLLAHRINSSDSSPVDLIARNRIPNPLFASGTLEYLRRG